MKRALSSLQAHVNEIQGTMYQGIKVHLRSDFYAPGMRIYPTSLRGRAGPDQPTHNLASHWQIRSSYELCAG
eukprot:4177743-Pleurochrysis_carterae.AAC.3